ncbi:MAG TPA: RDD family protein [Myxococcota bacterium]|nr:RDD family protein [Myxococcota bacterium]
MSERRLALQTPEEVPLTFELAPIGLRVVSFGLDLFLILLTVIFLSILVHELVIEGLYDDALSEEAAEVALALYNLLFFLIWNFYFITTELRWQGKTIGKRVAGLRVIARDGGPLSADLVFARNLTRDLETLIPLIALINPGVIGLDSAWLLALCWLWLAALLLLPLFNRYHARLGDLVAGTLVVMAPREQLLPDLVDHAGQLGQDLPLKEANPTDERYRFEVEQLDTYGIKELQILEDVLRRYPDQIDPELVATIADRIRHKIGWTPPDGLRFEAYPFLRAFYAAQRARLEHRMLFGQRREAKVR